MAGGHGHRHQLLMCEPIPSQNKEIGQTDVETCIIICLAIDKHKNL